MNDVVIAKNYLTEDELKILNNLVSGYFDFAEIPAFRHNPIDLILSTTGEKLLVGAGTISHNMVMYKAKAEYKKYQVKTISPVEKESLETDILKLEDPDYIAKYVREKYFYSKDGEVILRLEW